MNGILNVHFFIPLLWKETELNLISEIALFSRSSCFSVFLPFRSSPVVLVRGAGSAALVAASEESSERSTGQSAPAAAHELHEALALSRVSTQTKLCSLDH